MLKHFDGNGNHSFNTIAPNLPYLINTLVHELDHTFDLADTYVDKQNFSPPSTGGLKNTIDVP